MSTQNASIFRPNSNGDRRVIVHVVDTLIGGGTERTLVALLRAFDPSRFRHVVVTMRDAGRLASDLPDHAACRPLFSEGKSRRAGVRLAATVRELEADLVHARNTGCWFDATLARLANPRAKLILGYHGAQSSEPFGSRIRGKVRLGLLAGGHFTSVSGAGGRILRDQVAIPPRRIDVLQNGVDIRRFSQVSGRARREARETVGIAPGDFVVGCVGSLTPIKHHVVLLQAFAAAKNDLPNARVLIVGAGPLRETLLAQAAELGIGKHVVWVGQDANVPLMLRCMDLYVCCSAVEGISNAMLEAMASALPIVSTCVGDHATIVRDGVEGRIIQVGATRELAATMVDLARDAELRARWGAAAQRRAAAFSFDRTVRTYEAFYDRMLWRRSRS